MSSRGGFVQILEPQEGEGELKEKASCLHLQRGSREDWVGFLLLWAIRKRDKSEGCFMCLATGSRRK